MLAPFDRIEMDFTIQRMKILSHLHGASPVSAT
jgi:hypothetical protein